MSPQIARPSTSSGTALATAPLWLRPAVAATALAGIVGLSLAAAAWQRPVMALVTTQAPADRTMTPSYTTSVPRTPACDDTTVNSPDPVFRTVAKTVDVTFSYRGSPGTVAVSAELTAPSGWRSTVPLAAPTTFTTTRYNGTVRLDLAALEARAQAAAAVTGMPATSLTVAVEPLVTTAGATQFAPTLQLSLSPLELTLTDATKSLTTDDSATVPQVTAVPRTIGTATFHITMSAARGLSVTLLLAALVAGAMLAPVALRSIPTNEGAGIRRRYSQMLVSVEPMAAPPGRPLVDVAEFATLARLAERFGLLVLHWTRSDIDTFVVQDEGTTYRYRANAQAPQAAPAPQTTQPALEPTGPGDVNAPTDRIPTQRTRASRRAGAHADK